MTESYMVPEFDENGRFLSDKVNARIVDMIKANAPEQTSAGAEVIAIKEGHPLWPETLVEPLPDDLPMGSYLVNEPPFMGYYLSQKTPMGWFPVYFEKGLNYNDYMEGIPRYSVSKNFQKVEGVDFSATVNITKDRVVFSLALNNVNFAKDDKVEIHLEGPSYQVTSDSAVAQQLNMHAPDEAIVSHPMRVSSGGYFEDGESVSAWTFELRITKPLTDMSFAVEFNLLNPPDLRSLDKMYTIPSERVEITAPDPVFTMDETYMASTLTIPEVEGIVWQSSHQGGDAIVEPGTYEIDGTTNTHLTVVATPKKGYILTNGDDNGNGKWTWTKLWDFRHGIPITMPIPTPISSATEDGVDGWIVRYPDVPNARYTMHGGWDSNWNQILKVLSGDMFTPNGTFITGAADSPYYVVNVGVGTLQSDGTIFDGGVL